MGVASPLTTRAIARKLAPLYFTHINQAILTTLPFTVAVYMVRDFEATKGEAASEQTIGRLTGLLGAVFCAAQLVTSYPWGMVSDRIGRKPVYVLGNVSCVVSAVMFGLAATFWQAVLARALGGALNAIILCAKAMIGEGLPDKPSQAKAFGLMSLCWGLGSLAGPMIGGSLSAPCTTALRVDALCGQGSLLVQRPYFLPCFVAGLLSAIATVWTIFGLEETLPSRRRQGVLPYEPVPATEEAAAFAAAAAEGRQGQEVELGGIQHKASSSSSSSSRGSDLARDTSCGNSSKQQAGKGSWPFREDSAQGSPAGGIPAVLPPAAGMPPQQQQQQQQQQGLGTSGVTTAASRTGNASSSSLASSGGKSERDSMDEIIVFGPEDIAQEQPSSALAAPAAAGRAAAAGTAGVPWYKQRLVLLTLVGYGLIAWFFNMLDELTPIFASAAVADGGLSFSPSQLAPSLSFGGLVLVVWALKGYPWLMGRVGVVRALRLGLHHTVPLTLLIPCTSLFGGAQLPSQALMFLTLGLKAITATNAFTSCLILVNAAAPVDSLGAVNGAGQSLASLVRAVGPALGGLSWAWSLQLAEQPWWPSWLPHQYMPFVLAALLAAGTDIVYWNVHMPEAEEAGHSSSSTGGSNVDGSGSSK